MYEKSIELLKDKEFLEKILKMDSEEEVMAAFKERGAEITHEEFIGLRGSVNSISDSIEKLDESEIEKISGGVFGIDIATVMSIVSGLCGVIGSTISGVRKVNEGERRLSEAKQRAYEAEQHCNQVLLTSGAVVLIAGTLIYFKKDISKLWKKPKNER